MAEGDGWWGAGCSKVSRLSKIR
uniref:Uncharacterized protein n=1 Tax=Anguilla anguilla TaxID=7936 RepID=A0A0E9PI67_ANGAN